MSAFEPNIPLPLGVDVLYDWSLAAAAAASHIGKDRGKGGREGRGHLLLAASFVLSPAFFDPSIGRSTEAASSVLG